MIEILQALHSPDGIERVGFVRPGDDLIEVVNISPNPENSFMVQGSDIMKHVIEGDAIGTWHTHPRKDANLTVHDNEMFLMYPDLVHYIAGTDGVRKYIVQKGRVINA